jgi:HD superfamily phosphohydrolase
MSSLKSFDIKIKREIRDPIYNYVHVTESEDKVIDSPIFQRLDRLAQTSTSPFVYPSLRYSRKTHSLGVMHLVHRAFLHLLFLQSDIQSEISPLLFGELVVFNSKKERGLDNLSQKLPSDWWNSKDLDEKVQSLRYAGLLHDIGHAPFCHTFEEVCKKLKEQGKIKIDFDHEVMSRKIIKEKFKELNLEAPFTPDHINNILDPKGEAPQFLRELISSPYDCDKLDYLKRDAYHSGTLEYGDIDCERILDGFRVKDLKLCISSSAIDTLMNSFRAIQFMYTTVYHHKTCRLFDFMIADALEKIPAFLEEIVLDLDKFLKCDDCSFICEVKNRKEKGDGYGEAWEIFKKIRKREKVYKVIVEYPLSLGIATDAREEIKKLEKDLDEAGEDLKIRVDYLPDILPVRTEENGIYNWLSGKRIYDSEVGELKPLRAISETYFYQLLRHTVLFRIFGHRDQLKDRGCMLKAKKIEKEAKTKLKEIEEKYLLK